MAQGKKRKPRAKDAGKTTRRKQPSGTAPEPIPKINTDIPGLDDVLHGGLPEERTTLIKGSAGTGKTVLGLEFLCRSAMAGEPVIFVSFEESAKAVRQNALATGWDIPALEKAGKFFLWQAKVDRDTMTSGDFSIDSLLAVIRGKAEQMGARRIMIDAIDVLMHVFQDPAKERNELYRLHDWLLERHFTTILTAKVIGRSENVYRYEFLDYMADCIIMLDLRVLRQVATRRMRVVKYRGSGFCSNEYPYVITHRGNVILPVTTVKLMHRPLGEYISSGNAVLDRELGGGFHRSSGVVISGPTGCGKTTLAANFAERACSDGRKVLYVSFEESQEAIVDAMRSPGIKLKPALKKGRLEFYTIMPEALVSEDHLCRILLRMDEFGPDHVVVDAVSACNRMGSEEAAFDFLVRLINSCKQRGVTCLMTNQLSAEGNQIASTQLDISSIADTLVSIRFVESDGCMMRELLVVKSRGAHHSNRCCRYSITDNGITVEPINSETWRG